jgi:hypothetical protein
MMMRQFSSGEVDEARKRRSEAEADRRAAEQEALQATHDLCDELRSQAQDELRKAQESLTQAERIRDDMAAESVRLKDNAKAEPEKAEMIRSEADALAESIENAARERADGINLEAQDFLAESEAVKRASEKDGERELASAQEEAESIVSAARADAKSIRDELREAVAQDIRELMTDLDNAREAAQEELETQRLLTDTAKIRALSPSLNARSQESESEEPVELVPLPVEEVISETEPVKAVAKKKPVAKRRRKSNAA